MDAAVEPGPRRGEVTLVDLGIVALVSVVAVRFVRAEQPGGDVEPSGIGRQALAAR